MLVVEACGWADFNAGVLFIRWNQTTHYYYGVNQLPVTPFDFAQYRPHPSEKHAFSPIFINAGTLFPNLSCDDFNTRTVTRKPKPEETLVQNLEIIVEIIAELKNRQLLYVPTDHKLLPKQHRFFATNNAFDISEHVESASFYQGHCAFS